MSGGRPTNLNDEVLLLANNYINEDSEINYLHYDHAIPSVVGLCRVINRARSTVYLWAEDEDNEFSDILRSINEFQELTTLNGALKGELNAHISKLVLGKHGYSDKQETDNLHSFDFSNLSDEELKRIAGQT